MDTNILFSTKFNYQKIATIGSRTDACASGTTTTITIPHVAGRISSARVWYDPALGRRFPASFEQYQDDNTAAIESNGVTVRSMYLTTTDLVITYANTSASSKNVATYYRVYYDN
jgi:hypothetical protein